MTSRACSCARYSDGSVHTGLCPAHAAVDPCLTLAKITGRRRTGTIRRGVCTSCGHRSSASVGAGRQAGAMVHGFVFEVVRFGDGRAVAREHPAYCRDDGGIVWAPDRGYWRDAPADVGGTFLPAGDAARAWMLKLQRIAAADSAVSG